MKKLLVLLALSILPITKRVCAQGWPENYSGVMMQAFSWDDYDNTRWTEMESQADELANFFTLIWVPQSGNCGGKSMGYDPYYYYDHNSSFGTEDELRSMIKSFKTRGIGTIADVVINHRKTLKDWFDFPAETNKYNGETYQMFSTDVCADDDGGKAADAAKKQGLELSPNKDSGEGWDGFRDLDHASDNVQQNIYAYEEFLLNYLGYTGFRYDVAKGFAPKYFGMYNAKAGVEFSVGEYWDGNTSKVKTWISGTTRNGDIQSAAFDFPFRYTVRDAFNNSNNYKALNNESLNKDKVYRRYAVTFVENHDTEDRRPVGGDMQDPIKNAKDIPACNAILLAMPGTPCVFQPHWLNYKSEIKKMILARQLAGITNTSDYTVHEAASNRFTVECGDLLTIIGTNNADKAKELGFSLVTNGSKYNYYLRNSLEMVFVGEPSGTFDASRTPEIAVRIAAVTADGNAKLIYTTDGSEPSANSKTSYEVSSGYEVKISENTTLRVAMLMSDGTVKGMQTRSYTFVAPPPFEEHDATVYVKADFTPVYFYIWDSNNNTQLNGNWPGKRVDNNDANKVEIDGETWLKQTVHIKTSDYYFNIIFNQGNGKPQTADITRITSDRYFTATISNEQVLYKDVTSDYSTGIEEVLYDEPNEATGIYNLHGVPVSENYKGIVIKNGKKILNK